MTDSATTGPACEQARGWIDDLAGLGDVERGALAAHTATCDTCAALAAAETRIAAAFGATRRLTPTPRLTAALQAVPRAARHRRTVAVVPLAWGSLAAVAVMGLAGWLMRPPTTEFAQDAGDGARAATMAAAAASGASAAPSYGRIGALEDRDTAPGTLPTPIVVAPSALALGPALVSATPPTLLAMAEPRPVDAGGGAPNRGRDTWSPSIAPEAPPFGTDLSNLPPTAEPTDGRGKSHERPPESPAPQPSMPPPEPTTGDDRGLPPTQERGPGGGAPPATETPGPSPPGIAQPQPGSPTATLTVTPTSTPTPTNGAGSTSTPTATPESTATPAPQPSATPFGQPFAEAF